MLLFKTNPYIYIYTYDWFAFCLFQKQLDVRICLFSAFELRVFLGLYSRSDIVNNLFDNFDSYFDIYVTTLNFAPIVSFLIP